MSARLPLGLGVQLPTTGPTLPGRPGPGPRPDAPPRYVQPAFAMETTNGAWRPPTSADVVIKKGFDLRTPKESIALVRQQLTTPLDPQNASFLDGCIKATHQAFTISVNNCFIAGSPHDQLLAGLGVNEAVVLGSLRQSEPAVLKVSVPGEADPRYYVKTPNGFETTTAPKFVIYEGYVRRSPAGVEMRSPKWSSPALSGPTGTVTEL